MHKSNNARPPNEQSHPFQIPTSNKTVESSMTQTYLDAQEINMMPEFQLLLEQFQSLQKNLSGVKQQIQEIQKDTETNKNQLGYCYITLRELGFPVDEESLQDYQDWSEGNPWDD